MATGRGLPDAAEKLVKQDGTVTFAWYRALQRLASGVSSQDIAAFYRKLLERLGSPDGTLENLPPIATGSFLTKDTNVDGEFSIDYSGTLASGLVRLSLVSDEEAPLPTSYYGTGPLGEKGWRTIASALLPGEGITLTEDGAGTGVITVALAELEDSGAGALVAITRDAYGRIEGMKAATITGTAGRIEVANGDAVAGLPTLDLAAVPNGGAGAMQKTAFDAYGRATDHSDADTDDLAEGGDNLYFTDARAVAALEDTGPDYLQLLKDQYDP